MIGRGHVTFLDDAAVLRISKHVRRDLQRSRARGDREEAARLRRVFYQELQPSIGRRASCEGCCRQTGRAAELAALADELEIPSEAELLRRQRELSAPDGSL
jgi:hypothetical protein